MRVGAESPAGPGRTLLKQAPTGARGATDSPGGTPMLDRTLPDVLEDEDLLDLPPVERAVQLELRRRGIDL